MYVYGRRAKMLWLWVNQKQLTAIHILIGIIPIPIFLCSFCPLSKLRGRNFFVRWMECNTPLPEYVLGCVFVFSDRISDLVAVFVLYYELFIRSFCLESGFVNSVSASVWTGNSILVNCSIWSFCYSDLTDFSFKHHFPIFWIFYNFLEFSWIKLEIFKTGVDQCRWPIPGFLIYKRFEISKSSFWHYFLKSYFLPTFFFWGFYEFMKIPPESVSASIAGWFRDYRDWISEFRFHFTS